MNDRAVGPSARPPVFVPGVLALALAFAPACSPEPPAREVAPPVTPADSTRNEAPPPARSLSAVLAEHAPRIAAIPGVAGIGESLGRDGRPCVRIFVERLTPALERALPRTLEGWPVEIEESGPIRGLPDSTDADPDGTEDRTP